MGDGRRHRRRDLIVGRRLGEGVAKCLARPRVAKAFKKHGAVKQRRKIERGNREAAVDGVERPSRIAGRLAHRRELEPQRMA